MLWGVGKKDIKIFLKRDQNPDMYVHVLKVAIANMMKYKVHMGQSLVMVYDLLGIHMVTARSQNTKAYLW